MICILLLGTFQKYCCLHPKKKYRKFVKFEEKSQTFGVTKTCFLSKNQFYSQKKSKKVFKKTPANSVCRPPKRTPPHRSRLRTVVMTNTLALLLPLMLAPRQGCSHSHLKATPRPASVDPRSR